MKTSDSGKKNYPFSILVNDTTDDSASILSNDTTNNSTGVLCSDTTDNNVSVLSDLWLFLPIYKVFDC